MSKSHDTQVGKLDEVIGGIEDELKEAKAELKAAVCCGLLRKLAFINFFHGGCLEKG